MNEQPNTGAIIAWLMRFQSVFYIFKRTVCYSSYLLILSYFIDVVSIAEVTQHRMKWENDHER